ncbi:Ribosomal RNA processing protein [Gracilaria domingensis]|nr:Ribosomal RNA processing protein [Gracilaria domingensis]
MHKILPPSSGKRSNTPHREITKKPRKLSALQQRMRKKLSSAQFRMLNESMYTHTGAASKAMMDANPDLFDVYHAGYSEQVKQWPNNPLDDIIKYLSSRKEALKIVDLGCGEARLAKAMSHQKVHSFDLVASNEKVHACDISNLPLQDEYADVAVFCLSLMGTNYGDFLKEAHRVLTQKGLLLVAEVASRFEGHNPSLFITGVESLGYCLLRDHPLTRHSQKQEQSSKRQRRRKRSTEALDDDRAGKSSAFFYLFAFRKVDRKGKDESEQAASKLPVLAACLYKRR